MDEHLLKAGSVVELLYLRLLIGPLGLKCREGKFKRPLFMFMTFWWQRDVHTRSPLHTLLVSFVSEAAQIIW